MVITDNIGIIADDLTGANECSLNFHLHGCGVEILLDYSNLETTVGDDKQVWTISSESRNVAPEVAVEKVKEAARLLKNNFNIEYFYKKIDSTLRGNLACEALAMVEELGLDCALILPALPSENRITVGGYHLSRGVPIEKTEIARDPHSPIFESHIPTLLKKQLGTDDCVALLELDTVLKGAGPILVEMNRFIAEGKKLIVCDATSNVDIEQIALAMMKSNYKILPCGSSGLANILADIWCGEMNYQRVLNAFGNVPRLVISGSSTKLTKSQIDKLACDPIIGAKVHTLALTVEQVLNRDCDFVMSEIFDYLKGDNTVVVHSSLLNSTDEHVASALIDAELTKDTFAGVISDFLAEICLSASKKVNPVFITIGGETTYKCCKLLKCSNLLLVDKVAQAIPLCVDKIGHLIVSKSGNLGTTSTLIDIINYFNQYE